MSVFQFLDHDFISKTIWTQEVRDHYIFFIFKLQYKVKLAFLFTLQQHGTGDVVLSEFCVETWCRQNNY